jgi:hypothetical protein
LAADIVTMAVEVLSVRMFFSSVAVGTVVALPELAMNLATGEYLIPAPPTALC